MITPTQFKAGMSIELKEELYTILHFQHIKPGKGQAFVRTKLKNLKTGAITDKNFRPDEKVEPAHLEHRKMQYLYQTQENLFFMDLKSFEQISLSEGEVGDRSNFLKDGMTVELSFYEGRPVAAQLPVFVELTIKETPPGVKGDTASGGTKPAILETGLTIQVPLFVKVGDTVKVDTRTGEYVTRL